MHIFLTATSFLVCSKLLLFRYDNEGCSYLYDIDAHIDTSDLIDGVQPYVIDATKYGNVARFINHR